MNHWHTLRHEVEERLIAGRNMDEIAATRLVTDLIDAWIAESNARRLPATPAETGHPETPGYVPGATVTAGAILTAVTIATPAETGLDVERLARAIARSVGFDGGGSLSGPGDPFPGEPDAWDRKVAVKIAAEYTALSVEEPR